MPLGVSFNPTGDEELGNDALGAALQILSFHIPKFFGTSAVAPYELLTSPGFSGVDDSAIALRRMLRGILGSGVSDGAVSAPPPRVVPGVGQGEVPPGSGTPGAVDLPEPQQAIRRGPGRETRERIPNDTTALFEQARYAPSDVANFGLGTRPSLAEILDGLRL